MEGLGFFLHLGEQSQTQCALHLGQESFKSGGGEGFAAFLVPNDAVMPTAWGRLALHFCAQGVSFNQMIYAISFIYGSNIFFCVC